MTAPRPVLFIDNYFPVIDGVTETVHEYARHMNAPVVCPAMESRYREKYSFSYPLLVSKTFRIPFSRYASALPRLDRRLSAAIRAYSPDIFHLHSPSLDGRYAVSLGRKMGVPVVGTFHSKYYDAILSFVKIPALARKLTNQVMTVFNGCDEVWACSEETAETLRSYGYRKPCYVMPNGTDASYPANAPELKARAAERFGIPRGKHVLLFVGQQIWYKNQRLILDSFRLLCDQSDDFVLVMAGSGKDARDIQQYAASLGLTSRQVLFTGLISDRDLLRGVYLNADLLFFPSVFDNAPLVLREAAVLEVPTLVVEGSNAAGAIRKDVNGFTAPADALSMSGEITRIFAQGLAPQAGHNARETIPIPWEKLVPAVLDRYQVIIDRFAKSR